MKGESTGQYMASLALTSDGREKQSLCSDLRPVWGTGTMAFGGLGTFVFVVKNVVSRIGNCSLGTEVFGNGLQGSRIACILVNLFTEQ